MLTKGNICHKCPTDQFDRASGTCRISGKLIGTDHACRACICPATPPHFTVDFGHDGKPPAIPAHRNLPSTEWPLWAKAIGVMKAEGDIGVGDTVHRLLGSMGAAYSATLKAMGMPCGCDDRRQVYNVIYRY